MGRDSDVALFWECFKIYLALADTSQFMAVINHKTIYLLAEQL